MGYFHDKSKDICKHCHYKEVVRKKSGHQVNYCQKYETYCKSAQPKCPYTEELKQTTAHRERCEEFNAKFKHRYRTLDNSLGF